MPQYRPWRSARLTRILGTLILTVATTAAVVRSRPIAPLRAADGAGTSAEQQAALAAIQDAIIAIADRVEPTVVSIDAVEGAKGGGERRAEASNTRPFSDGSDSSTEDEEESSGGSGIIVREDSGIAYVLTNQHVIDGADQIRVRLHSKQEYRASVVGIDPTTDLAVLRFRPARPLGATQIARLGDSELVRVGQYALAIGSPLGYDFTFTKGVISAKGRDLEQVDGNKDYRGLLQTDASINPGNSGGPLLNIDGEVVGINVAIASPTGSSVGLGFAIPSNTARRVMNELIAHGTVTRGFLGVRTARENEDLSLELQQFYGVESGALIENVIPDTPAAQAGLRSEDIVVALDGHPLLNYGDLIECVQNSSPGTRVEVRLVRDHQSMGIWVTLGSQAAPAPSSAAKAEETGKPVRPESYGVTVAAVREGGVVVRDVKAAGPAEEAGLTAGDIILRCGATPIRSVSDWRQALAEARGALVLRVQKGDTGYAAVVVMRAES